MASGGSTSSVTTRFSFSRRSALFLRCLGCRFWMGGFSRPSLRRRNPCSGFPAGAGTQASRAAVGPEWTGPAAQDRRCLSGPPVRAQNVGPTGTSSRPSSRLTWLLRNDQYEQVHHRLIRRFVAALGPLQGELDGLEPIDLTLDVDGPAAATAVRVRVRDSFGFLSLTASALALCGIRIVQSEIRTDGDRVDDVLWVTDRWGQKIVSEPKLRELRLSLILIEHFSSRLPRATDPEAALVHFSRFATETMARPDWAEEFEALERPEVLDALVRVLGESHFLWEEYLHAQPENVLPMISDPAEWTRPPGREQLAADLESSLAGASTRAPWPCDQAVPRSRDLPRRFADDSGVEPRAGPVFRRAFRRGRGRAPLGLWAGAPGSRARHFQGDMDRIPPSVLCALGKFGGRELGSPRTSRS